MGTVFGTTKEIMDMSQKLSTMIFRQRQAFDNERPLSTRKIGNPSDQ
jgi:hypothetical protein